MTNKINKNYIYCALLERTQKHRAGVELRNKVVIGIAMLAWTIFIAGYVNYYMLLQIPTAYLAQFFSEIGLLAPLIFGNGYIIIRLGGKKVDAAAAWLAVVALAAPVSSAASALAIVAVALAAVLAVMALAAESSKYNEWN
jgi:hypothetical protein